MRDLFLSERRCVGNILNRHLAIDLAQFRDLKVRAEHYSPARSSARSNFNHDFALQFGLDSEFHNFKSYSAPVLPNTIGAEVFLTVDKATSMPLRLELLAGEAFPIKYFERPLEQIERALEGRGIDFPLKSSAYSRVLVVEGDICFLAFRSESAPLL